MNITDVRLAQRWAKFAQRGYDMSLSSPVLALSDLIELDRAQEVENASKELQPHDTVNSLMGGLP